MHFVFNPLLQQSYCLFSHKEIMEEWENFYLSSYHINLFLIGAFGSFAVRLTDSLVLLPTSISHEYDGKYKESRYIGNLQLCHEGRHLPRHLLQQQHNNPLFSHGNVSHIHPDLSPIWEYCLTPPMQLILSIKEFFLSREARCSQLWTGLNLRFISHVDAWSLSDFENSLRHKFLLPECASTKLRKCTHMYSPLPSKF